MKIHLFTYIFILTCTLSVYSQGYSIEILKQDGKIFSKNNTDKTITFKINEISESSVDALTNKAVAFEGVNSFVIEKNEEQYIATAVLSEDMNEAQLQKLLLTLNIQVVYLGEREIETIKLAETFNQDAYYRKELRKFDKRIADMEVKLNQVLEDEVKKAEAESQGWIEATQESINKIKAEKQAFINGYKKN